MRSQLFAIATVALSGVFTVLMFRSLKLVADAWFIGCVFHADGSKTCRWDVVWLPDPCLPPPPPPPPNTLGGSNGTLMHALFMSLAFGLLTPIGSISFTARAAACAAAWPNPQVSSVRVTSWHLTLSLTLRAPGACMWGMHSIPLDSIPACAAAWPRGLLLAPGALALAHHHPSGLPDSARHLGAREGAREGQGD